ncbi:hypothetical protein Taro_003457 [Colocasia esculenta]|uniref:Amine oxidase domain-containing protein n=1 Tax=Colocasia esculenta TaxID=4460 RepID=A0A843TNV8_COLES|nr:hypothetical protein [Colocasia esculenta]
MAPEDAKGVTTGAVRSVAVVGGGVSGLAAAYKLKSNGLRVTVFEAEGRAGGKIRSGSQEGLIWDEGANTMTESEEEVKQLLNDTGLREKQQYPILQNKRYIVRDGVPELFMILLEPLLWRNSRGRGKSLRVSTENSEERFGSVIIGAIRSKLSGKRKGNKVNELPGKTRSRRGSFSFRGGMQTLIDTLCGEIGSENLKLNTEVLSLACNIDGNTSFPDWRISIASDRDNQRDHLKDWSFDAIIMTAPLCNVQEMKFTRRGMPFMLDFLPKVTYMPLSVLITSFRKDDVKKPLEGFGVLVPSKEQESGLKTLGTLFSSMMFPDRAPSDQYLYTTFIGGSRNRDLAGASPEELKKIVLSDLHKLLGIDGQPKFIKHVYWRNAFPLYGLDYSSVIEAIDKMEQRNHRDGLSVGKVIASGYKAADRVISYLNASVKQETT